MAHALEDSRFVVPVAGLCTRNAWAKGPAAYLTKPDSWFGTVEAERIAANILSYQVELGGWPKNMDTTAEAYHGAEGSSTDF